jgi:capsid portal protein
MNFENELPVNYNECNREQLIELISKRDENFIKLGNAYLEVMNMLGNIIIEIENEANKTIRIMKTEFTLSQAGVPSSDEKNILEKEIGRMEAFDFILKVLAPIYNKK